MDRNHFVIMRPRRSATCKRAQEAHASACALIATASMGGSAESVYSRCRRRKVWQSIGSELDAYGTRSHLPGSLDAPTPMYPMSFPLTPHYRSDGSIISANE